MGTARVTELPGDKLRKAIGEYCELKQLHPEKTMGDLIEKVCRKFDLSPLETEFLQRQLLEKN